MGLVSFLLGAGRAVARTVGGAAGLVPRVTPAAAVAAATGRGALQAAGRFAVSPVGGGLIGGVGGVALGEQLFGGDGAAVAQGSQLAMAIGQGLPSQMLAGGRTLVTAANGDIQVFNRAGTAVRPSLIVPAGQRLPGGAVVVSVRQGGALIGITTRRRRRAFATEVRRVRSTIQGCRAVLRAAEKTKSRR